MRRCLLTALAAAGVLGASATLPATSAAAPTSKPVPVSRSTPDAVVQWNRFLLGIQATPGDQPATIHPTYELAVVHTAINDAVVAIDHSAKPYLTKVHGPRSASRAAAADAAAHRTLVKLYPSLQPSIDQKYADLLTQLPPGRHKTQGIQVGEHVARQILARRANDGSSAAPIAVEPGTHPGDYQLTPPAFAQPVFTHWRFVKPFVLRHTNQFRPARPAPLTSAKYAAAINEVKTLGVAQSSTRTPDQTQIGRFWNPPIWATWNQIAQTAALGHHATLSKDAHTFATLNLTLADAVIAFYDAKYTFRFWRPVTAIRHADIDGNPNTTAAANWTPLSTTAPDPSYPGAHGTISAAAATVLRSIHGNRFTFTVTSPALPSVHRSFHSFTKAEQEATISRIYNGNHTRLDQVAGEDLGRHIAQFMLHHQPSPAPGGHH